MYPYFALAVLILIVVLTYLWLRNNKKKWILPSEPFSEEWKRILAQEVGFYKTLNEEEQSKFEYKVQEFLLNCRITGIQTDIDTTDKLLVAASAIIPIFSFPEWKYWNIDEVLIYPERFNVDFDTEGAHRSVLGMVGNGYMQGKMILSKNALRNGFKNERDKRNTAIHEFVHLIDMSDGTADGIPGILLDKQYTIPWLDLMNKKIEEIFEGKSDINPYGGTNRAEFFSVVSEYFFERPKLLEKKHPELYDLLERIFNQDMAERRLTRKTNRIGRNDPCPCKSGEKFKECCGSVHYR